MFFWEFIDWKIVIPFLLGAFFGALAGARIYIELPETVIALAIGAVMLIAIWLPSVSWRPRLRHPWAVVGFTHSLLSTLFAYGAVLHAVILHTGLKRQQVVGTLGGCLSGMSVFKIVGYASFGFDYSPYYHVIVAAVTVSLIGTAIGKMIVDKLSEQKFRFIFRALITATALRLLYVGISATWLR
jgi:uncharacterized membrane protein YfcA